MKIANIYPVANQHFYKDEPLVMILAHLVKKGLYNPENFNNNQYVIMDNGLFEKQQISTRLIDCINCAEESGIKVNEIIIPDAINDSEETIRLFLENLPTIEQYQHKYRFMFVAQAITYDELKAMIEFANQFDLNLSIGISKLSPLQRDHERAIEAYRKSKHPIHFLGLKSSFSELNEVKDVVRSCDSSQLAFIVKNHSDFNLDFNAYKRDGIDIDLELDELDNDALRRVISLYNEQIAL